MIPADSRTVAQGEIGHLHDESCLESHLHRCARHGPGANAFQKIVDVRLGRSPEPDCGCFVHDGSFFLALFKDQKALAADVQPG